LPKVERATITAKAKLTELSGSMVLAVTLSVLFAILWAAVDQSRHLAELGASLYLLVLTSWAVLLPSKIWDQRKGDQWLRRGVMLVLGLGLGFAAAFFNGWQICFEAPDSASLASNSLGELGQDLQSPTKVFGYLAYFGLLFALLRWWKLTERTRPRRFSLWPVLVTASLALLFSPLWPDFSGHEVPFLLQGPVVLTLTSVIVQLVSPWEEPAPRPARKLRLRYA
jgi:glucan phosphoethanolaminetransferase (alkaline phosphatase superfamily)